MKRITLVITHLSVLIVGILVANASFPTYTTALTGTHEASANIVAVAEGQDGTVGQVTARIEPGNGKVLLDTNPFVETDTQLSAKTARNVAEHVTGISLENKNVIYTFTIKGNYIGGPSAGAAMTLATIAAIRNQTIPVDVVATGTIRPDGRLGNVGAIIEKAITAGKDDITSLFVPHSQSTITTYQQVVEEQEYRGLRCRDIRYVPQTIRLNNITRDRYNMSVHGVSDIHELMQAVLTT